MDKNVFEETYKEIKAGALQLFREQFTGTGKDAVNDVGNFMEESKGKIEKWTAELANGEIDESLFKQFITNQQAILQMKLLTHTGLTKVKTDRFLNALTDIVINKLLDKFLPLL